MNLTKTYNITSTRLVYNRNPLIQTNRIFWNLPITFVLITQFYGVTHIMYNRGSNQGLPLPVNCWLTVHVRVKCTHLNCNDKLWDSSNKQSLYNIQYRSYSWRTKNQEMVTIKLAADNMRRKKTVDWMKQAASQLTSTVLHLKPQHIIIHTGEDYIHTTPNKISC